MVSKLLISQRKLKFSKLLLIKLRLNTLKVLHELIVPFSLETLGFRTKF